MVDADEHSEDEELPRDSEAAPAVEGEPRVVSHSLRRKLVVALGVLGILLVCLYLFDPFGLGRLEPLDGDETEAEGTDTIAVAVEPGAHVDGQILIEKPVEAGEGEAEEDTSSDSDPSPNPEHAPMTLHPPDAGSCTIIPWQDSQAVGPPVSCDADGRFSLELDAGVVGTVAVEMLIPGRLRGLVEIEADGDPNAKHELPVVALGLGFTLSGKTVDARGEPLSGVTLQAMPVPNLGESEPWRARSGPDGAFAFETLPHGRVNLRAIKEGFSLSVVETLSPSDDVLVVLDALIDLQGSVVGDAELLSRARVRLEGSSLWPPIDRPIAADGTIEVESLPDGIYAIEVIVPPRDGDPREWASIPLENVTPDLHIGLALIEAHRVPVRVVDPDGEPVAGARITLGYSSVGLLQKHATSDEEGRARVGPVVPGPYLVRADADGFLPAEPLEIQVEPQFEGAAGELDEQVLVLARPARIEGIVVDEEDRPVPGASVVLDGEGSLSFGESDARAQIFGLGLSRVGSLGTTKSVPDIPKFDGLEEAGEGVVSDENGRFVIDMLEPGRYGVRARHGEHAASALHTVELTSGQVRRGVRLRLRQGSPLSGVIRTSNGQPIAYAQIEFDDGMILMADDRGAFDAGLRRGKQTIILRALGMVPRQVRVRVDKPLDLELEMEPANGRVEGRVRDTNDQPIEDVEVNLRMLDGLSPSAIEWTDDRGLFEFDMMATGNGVIGIHHRDYVDVELKTQLEPRGTDPIEIVLDQGWTVEVEVRSAGRGEPIKGARVDAGIAGARTNADGMATVEHLAADEVEVVVTATGWVSASSVLGRDQSNRAFLRLELEEAGSLEGEVSDERGEPIAGAAIRVLDPETGKALAEGATRAKGRFKLEGVRAGAVIVEVTPPHALSAVLAPIEVDSDVQRGTVTRDLLLRFDRL